MTPIPNCLLGVNSYRAPFSANFRTLGMTMWPRPSVVKAVSNSLFFGFKPYVIYLLNDPQIVLDYVSVLAFITFKMKQIILADYDTLL